MTSTRVSKPILTLGIAAIGFFITPTASQAADTPELKALKAALGSVAPASATDAQLAAAVVQAIGANAKLKPGNIAGEALKAAGVNTVDPGAAIADATDQLPSVTLDLAKYVGSAAVRAATGKTPNASEVSSFSAFLLSDDTTAVNAALAAKSSPTAAGAVLGGRSLDLATDLAKIQLTNTAFATNKLNNSIQSIAAGVGDSAVVPGAYASQISTAKNVLKVAVGVASTNPTQADSVVDALLATNLVAPTVIKKAATIAKKVGLVADVEQVQLLATTLGSVVASKDVAKTAKALAQAISGRNPAAGLGSLSLVNKADEVGEVAAYFLAAVESNSAIAATFTDAKKAAALVSKIALNIFKGAKVKKVKGQQTPTDLQAQLVVKDGNFAGSFGYTLSKLGLTQPVFDAIKARLAKDAKKIGGSTFGQDLADGFVAGYAAVDATGFEDGTAAGSVVDPETDTRNG